ncbi:hypothetical protein GYRE_00764 [Yokenella regensburgei ATCC 49455]|uniref:DUF1120 domain-containing protein n=1 Tax=Yokenella regensburgei TaxID=158877 RepID=A0AB38FUP3_9ENTR|nr:hypothetical protein GYRE_00764 [Yokenella regensburgei ATCC 49455]SQA62989.1 Uncharacterised protein [Yokenella regensburgei]SQB02233.1 Uncharacterised protein [Yokenella regensburgei]SUQ07467.1 Uncharacterised protein [Yokenella regensburgei]
MKKTNSSTYTKTLMHMAVAAALTGSFAAPAFADVTPQEFHAKVNIKTDNTCSLTITPGTSTYNSTLRIDTGEETAQFEHTAPVGTDQAALTEVAYSAGCTFTGLTQTLKHTGNRVPDAGKPSMSNPRAFGVPAGTAMLQMGAYPTASHLYNEAGVDISDKFTVSSPGNNNNALSTSNTPLPTTMPYNSYKGTIGKTCGTELACLGYWATNRSGQALAKHDSYDNTATLWVNTYAPAAGATGAAATRGEFGLVFLNNATPMKLDGSGPDDEGIPDGTDVHDTWTMEFSIT